MAKARRKKSAVRAKFEKMAACARKSKKRSTRSKKGFIDKALSFLGL